MYVHLYVWKLTRRYLYRLVYCAREWHLQEMRVYERVVECTRLCITRSFIYTEWGSWKFVLRRLSEIGISMYAYSGTRTDLRELICEGVCRRFIHVYTCQNVGARYVLGKCTRVCVMRFVVCIHVLYVFKRTYMDACSCAYAYVCERM